MKAVIIVMLLVTPMVACGSKQRAPNVVMENGIEVILNHLEPYKLNGERSSFYLEEELKIDMENEAIAGAGLTDMNGFDADSEGNVYFFQDRESEKSLIYKFDHNGKFVMVFGRRGQGPGEIEVPVYQHISKRDEIPIQDFNTHILHFYDGKGALLRGFHIGKDNIISLTPLDNGNYIGLRDYVDPSTRHRYDILSLYDAKFDKISELDRCDYGQIMMASLEKKAGSPRVFIYEIANGMIYLGHENRGYEILVFSMDGKLLRKIRKEYRPAGVPDEFKENLLVNFGRYKDRLSIPDTMPPFHYFFLDDEQRLYVKTYERGQAQNEYLHDVFNSAGYFIKRISLPSYGNWMYPGRELNRPKIKNHHLYCIREKTSGYKELVIYRLIWK